MVNDQVKRNNNRNGRTGRARNQNNLLVPVDVAQVGFAHTFSESGGTFQITPPKTWGENKRPTRVSSLNMTYASSVPVTLSCSFFADDAVQFETIPVISSVTTKSMKLKLPRNVDFSYNNWINIVANGPVTFSGTGVFVTKSTSNYS